MITLGCILYSIGFILFISPNNLAPGGITGISVILGEFVPLGEGILVLILNIPLLIIGLWKFGRAFLLQTVYATVISSFMMEGMSYLVDISRGTLVPTNDLLLAGIVGGATVGCGMGIIFRCGATTGGTDVIVKLVCLRFRHVKTGNIFIVFDSIVVMVSAVVFRNVEIALYTAVTLVVTSFVLDTVLYSTDGARLVYIVSEKHNVIADKILDELDVGATYVRAVGAYSGTDKNVLMVAVKKHIFPKLKTVVGDIDENSFMIVCSASEIFGEGFKRHNTVEF